MINNDRLVFFFKHNFCIKPICKISLNIAIVAYQLLIGCYIYMEFASVKNVLSILQGRLSNSDGFFPKSYITVTKYYSSVSLHEKLNLICLSVLI